MREKYYKNRKLVSVFINTERQEYFIEYQREKPGISFLSLRFGYKPAGFYSMYDLDYITVEDILKSGYVIKNNKVYYKPFVVKEYENGETEKIEFDTEEETIECYNNLKKEVK